MKSGRFPFRFPESAAVIAAALFLLTGAPPASAHPHVWIDARAGFELDDTGEIAAIHIEWRFDEFFSAYAIDELSGGDEESITVEQRAALAKQYVDNLVEWNYMTELAVDDGYAELGPAKDYSVQIEDGIVTLVFALPVAEPVDPHAHNVGLRMYDPTYYISIEYAPDDPLAIAGTGAEDCEPFVDEARPEMETVPLSGTTFAAAERSTEIGFLFAQTGRLSCD